MYVCKGNGIREHQELSAIEGGDNIIRLLNAGPTRPRTLGEANDLLSAAGDLRD